MWWDQVRAASPPSPAGIVCLVVTIMYWSGWEMGAVEAISLSILVGSSVDYCVHLVEGYLLAGENLPPHQAEVSTLPGLPLPINLSHLSAVEGHPRTAGHPVPDPQPRCVLEAVGSRTNLPGDLCSKAAPPSRAVGPERVRSPSLPKRA